MTDKVKGCVVAFDKDIRVDDVQVILDAIRMIKGVVGVEISISNLDDWMARERIKSEIREKLLELYNSI